MGLNREIVELKTYDSNWRNMFESEKLFLINILKDNIIEIEHVGSTSIPGLKAKPIIDICVVIKDLQDAPKFNTLLSKFDYYFVEEAGEKDRYFYAKGPENNRTYYLHFVEKNSNSYNNLIMFKDYLIKNPKSLLKYQKIKETLAKKYPNERSKYTLGKADFIKSIMKKILKERRKKEYE
ncbi:MAG: GrpB family protein [Bacilli bacterium]|nr:GrpB family protein [Bacilli bacterium]